MEEMIRILCRAALLSLTVATLWPHRAAGQSIKEADACGYVVDAQGSVLSEATVLASSGDKRIATATTLSDGSFHFQESVPPGVTLTVKSPHFADAVEVIARIKAVHGDNKCKHPLYVVLGSGVGSSFITDKKKMVPKPR